jgi:hypothetical protein
MKHLIFVTTLFILVSCTSCSNNNASAAGNKENAATVNPTSSASTGNAVFSYNLDGAKISGGEVDELMMNNAAFITKSDNGDKLSFFLGDAYQKNTETFAHSLRFAIPDKTGAVTLTPDEDNWSVQLFLGNNKDDKYVLYANENFSATVTNISATRVSGTFSGQLKLVESTGAGKSELAVTDGKFDIPIRSTK